MSSLTDDEDDDEDDDDEDDEDDFDIEAEEHFDEDDVDEEVDENPKKKQKTAVVEASQDLDELDDETYDWKIETEEDKAQKLALSLEKDLHTARLCEKLQKRKDLIRTMIKERQKVQRARRVLKRRGSCLQQKCSIKPNYTGHHKFT